MTKHSKILTLFLAFSFILAVNGIAQLQADETVVCAAGGDKAKFAQNQEEDLQKKAEMKEVYTCPMHPEVKSDKPGKCPKCGMNLEKKMMPMEKMMSKEKMMHMEQMEKEHMHMKGEEKACCAMMGVMSHEGVEMNVENTQDGIVVKITSKNAEVAKKLQEMAAKMKEMHKKKEAKKEEVEK